MTVDDSLARGGRPSRRAHVAAEIYEQAARLFAERGFAGTTPQDIADAVGMSRQSLYYYVSNKEEILERLVSEMTSQTVDEMTVIVRAGRPALETLRELAQQMVRDRALNRTRFRLLDRSESALPASVADVYLRTRRETLALVIEVVEAGVREGVFRPGDARVDALSVLGMCNWVAWWYEPAPDRPVERTAEAIADNVIAMLRVHDAPVGPNDPRALVEALGAQLERLKRML